MTMRSRLSPRRASNKLFVALVLVLGCSGVLLYHLETRGTVGTGIMSSVWRMGSCEFHHAYNASSMSGSLGRSVESWYWVRRAYTVMQTMSNYRVSGTACEVSCIHSSVELTASLIPALPFTPIQPQYRPRLFPLPLLPFHLIVITFLRILMDSLHRTSPLHTALQRPAQCSHHPGPTSPPTRPAPY